MVVFVHGGCWTIGERWQYASLGSRLAQEGIICIVATYSLYPATFAPEMVLETSGVLTWAQRHAAEFGGDPRRVYLVGHSAGSHITSLAVMLRAYFANLV